MKQFLFHLLFLSLKVTATTHTRIASLHYTQRSVVKSENLNVKRQLLLHKTRVPVLYADLAVIESEKKLTLEHVVPISKLRTQHPGAAKDVRNVFLAYGAVNNLRSNYRFCFYDIAMQLRIAQNLTCGVQMRNIGFGNFIDTKQKLFFPRRKDFFVLARTLLYMHETWTIPLNTVTVNTSDELLRLVSGKPPSKAEILQSDLLTGFAADQTKKRLI